MLISLILGLIIGAISVIFALQNIFLVTVTFMAWELTTPLALIIAIAILTGLLIGIIFSIPEFIKNTFVVSNLKKENKKLSDELELAHKKNPQPVEPVETTQVNETVV